MTYDTKRRILHTGVREKVELSQIEHKILICLSSGNAVTHEEISKYLYGVYDEYTKKLVRQFIHFIRFKTKNQLKVKTIIGVGYILESEIYFE